MVFLGLIDTEWLTLEYIQLKITLKFQNSDPSRSVSQLVGQSFWTTCACEERPKVYSSRFFARRGTPAAQLPQLPHAVTKRRALVRFVGTKWAPKTSYPAENPENLYNMSPENQ